MIRIAMDSLIAMICTICWLRWAKVSFEQSVTVLTVNFTDPSDKYLEDMMNEAPGPINFTMFLTMFGEKLNGTDPEDVIKNAFACFDDDNTGLEKYLNNFLNNLIKGI